MGQYRVEVSDVCVTWEACSVLEEKPGDGTFAAENGWSGNVRRAAS